MHDCPDCRHLEHELEETRNQLEKAREAATKATNLLASGEALRAKMLFQSIVNPPAMKKGSRIDTLAGQRVFSPVMGLHTKEERDQAATLMANAFEGAMEDYLAYHDPGPLQYAAGYISAIAELADKEDALDIRKAADDLLDELEKTFRTR